MHASKQAKAFFAAHRRTRQVQDRLLDELVNRHGDTAFGRDHHFSSIRGWADFRANVPIGTYETLRPYMQRVFNGETDALLPAGEQVLMFSTTSGTTGKPKHIPVTSRFLADMRRGWNIFGLTVLRDHPDGWLRRILQISSPMRQTVSATGLPCGAISGLLAGTQKKIVRRMYVVPPIVADVHDATARFYTTLRCGVGQDVAILTTANPSSTIKMIETGQEHVERLIRDVADGTLNPPGELAPDVHKKLSFRPDRQLARRLEAGLKRDGQLLPRHFWNIAFLTNWTGGTLKLYLRRLRELFGDVPVRDIGLLASEGRFSIPIADNTPAGLAEITGNLLEFIPADERDARSRRTLRADELEIGQEYFLLVSNRAGLWRYDIDDRIRVVERFGDSPVFEFLSRGLNTASITGEKITEHQVVEAMRLAAGGRVDRFELQGHFATTPYYQLRMEDADGADPAALAKRLDEALAELNFEYASKRSSGRLGPIRVHRLAGGAFARTDADRTGKGYGRIEQYKPRYLLAEVIDDETTGDRP